MKKKLLLALLGTMLLVNSPISAISLAGSKAGVFKIDNKDKESSILFLAPGSNELINIKPGSSETYSPAIKLPEFTEAKLTALISNLPAPSKTAQIATNNFIYHVWRDNSGETRTINGYRLNRMTGRSEVSQALHTLMPTKISGTLTSTTYWPTNIVFTVVNNELTVSSELTDDSKTKIEAVTAKTKIKQINKDLKANTKAKAKLETAITKLEGKMAKVDTKIEKENDILANPKTTGFNKTNIPKHKGLLTDYKLEKSDYETEIKTKQAEIRTLDTSTNSLNNQLDKLS